MNCEEVNELILSSAIEGTAVSDFARSHIKECPGCQAFLASQAAIELELADSLDEIAVPFDFEAKLHDRLNHDRLKRNAIAFRSRQIALAVDAVVESAGLFRSLRQKPHLSILVCVAGVSLLIATCMYAVQVAFTHLPTTSGDGIRVAMFAALLLLTAGSIAGGGLLALKASERSPG